MGFYIPKTMQKYNNWVVWRKENNKKIPYNPRTGSRTDPTKSCCSFDDALLYYKYGGDFEGIGFTLPAGCGFTFIDLDNCIDENGNETELAIELQEIFKDSYIEISQSEKGLHIICMGTIPRMIKTENIEIYSCDRYIAMTGNTTNGKEPQRAQKELDLIFDRFKTEKAENEPQREPQGHIYNYTMDAKTLIDIISHSRQGEKWKRLHDGEWEKVLDAKGKPYTSQSEAVQAYAAITNYFAGGRVELIKEVFAQSWFTKANKKYKNPYYIDKAIQKAQETATGSRTGKRRIKTKIIEVYEGPQRGRRRA